MKQHTKPCGQCPWRRASAPGWLGASTTLEFLFQAEHEPKMPCHATIDYEDEHWQDTQLSQAPRCAGHAIYLRNRGKMPADAETAAFVRTVEPDRENVFGMHFEFVSHHGGDESRIMGVLMGLDSGA
jgi:hypothetical protein